MASVEPYRPPREEYRAPAASKSEAETAADSVLPAAPSPPSSSRKSPPSVEDNATTTNNSTKPSALNGPKEESRPAELTEATQNATSSFPPDTALPQRPPTTVASHSGGSKSLNIDLSKVSSPQWYFTEAETLSTPSVLDGISPAEERLRRAKGVNFIYQAGGLLRLPHNTLWVASVFFHRFYMRFSMVEQKHGVHHYNIAATALFLANKTEESCRKTKEIIIAVAKVGQKNPNLIIDEQSKDYWRWRDSILAYEELMLELLTFDLKIDCPFDYITEFSEFFSAPPNIMAHEIESFCNEIGMTMLPLILPARDISMASIFYASVRTQAPLYDNLAEKSWWTAFHGDAANLYFAIRTLLRLHEQNPLRRQLPNLSLSQFDLEKTRRVNPNLKYILPPDSVASARASVRASASMRTSVSMNTLLSANTGANAHDGTTNGNGRDAAVSPTPSLKRKADLSEDGEADGVAKRSRTAETVKAEELLE